MFPRKGNFTLLLLDSSLYGMGLWRLADMKSGSYAIRRLGQKGIRHVALWFGQSFILQRLCSFHILSR